MFQKIILLSFVNDDEVRKFDVVKSVLEYMKPYMNLELYVREKDIGKDDGKTITNTAFEHQSKVGRATGVAQSPKWVREALAKHFAELKNRQPKKVVWSDDTSILG